MEEIKITKKLKKEMIEMVMTGKNSSYWGLVDWRGFEYDGMDWDDLLKDEGFSPDSIENEEEKLLEYVNNLFDGWCLHRSESEIDEMTDDEKKKDFDKYAAGSILESNHFYEFLENLCS
jgi:hypothetical protein